MNMTKLLKNKVYIIIFLLMAALLPLVISNKYLINVCVMVFLFAAMAVAWNIIGGYGAQISFGHSAFSAMGAYTSFILFLRFNVPPLISIFAGMVIAVIIAFIIGYPSFRLRGTFFSLSTIAFAEIVRVLLLYFKNLTGGAEGLVVPFKGENPLYLQFYSPVPFYYIAFVLLLIIIFLTWMIEKSKLGYFLKAIREDEDAAQSLGIKAYKIKLLAFMISAAMMAAVGTISAFNVSYIDPSSVGSIDLSIQLGVIAIIGGIGTLWGPVLGAMLLIPLTEITNALLGSSRGGASMALYGLVLMIIIIFQPNGIMGFINTRKSKIKSKPAVAEGGVGKWTRS